MRRFLHVTILLLLCLSGSRMSVAAIHKDQIWMYENGPQTFEWDLLNDKASLRIKANNAIIWKGSLLPSFWLLHNQQKIFVKPLINQKTSAVNDKELTLSLQFDNIGTGTLTIVKETWGIRFSELTIQWQEPAPAIIDMYFGMSVVNPDSNLVSLVSDEPFMSDWQSFGFAVPGAKGGTVQSYFRMWDFGQANIALGSFGPALGSPYGAAFPRPLYYAAMGSDMGFMTVGAGNIPDAAMSLKIQATNACIRYLYREDLWGASTDPVRKWQEPLRITMGANAYEAIEKYYSSFPPKVNTGSHSHKSIWNTWGMWRDKNYVIEPIADFAKKSGAGILVLDDPWESSQGSGKPNLQKFPSFFKNIEYTRKQGLEIGVWEAIAWIADPYEAGLKDEDLLLKKNGKPCKASWNFSPWSDGYYCLDISSERTRKYIEQRTINLMRTIKPSLIKLDFGYGCPDPSVTAPRNPAYRGERYAYELVNLISKAARSINPDVVMMYYSISPLWSGNTDLVSMDDQGDLWYDIRQGHQEWSIWASLLSTHHMGLNGSSSYDWSQDDEVLLNTCILGSPGSVLPSAIGKQEVPAQYINRRLAVNRWCRKTAAWKPLWLNSFTGNFSAKPALHCWGRLEANDNDTMLTALALRDTLNNNLLANNKHLAAIHWAGNWALIAQDQADIFHSDLLAIIPFGEGSITLPVKNKPATVIRLSTQGEEVYKDWQWKDDKLTLTITKELFTRTAGFLVKQ